MGIIAKPDRVESVSKLYGIPKFFQQKIPLNGEGKHDEIENKPSDGKLLDIDGYKPESYLFI